MLLAYIDEIGKPGAFISPDDKRYSTSPAFGYTGFIIPAENARQFGAIFNRVKLARFEKEIRDAEDPLHWEAKGADLFRATTPEDRPENLRIFGSLVTALKEASGSLFTTRMKSL